jgi:SAM-dependent methyltransferase
MSAERAAGSSASEPWYVTAFGAAYRDVYAHRDLESARHEARWLVEHGVRGRVLDLCCGFARHTLALRELGCDAFGLDLSEELLAQAARLPNPERLAGRLVRGDARSLPFADASFAAIVMLFSSFGYFDVPEDERVLSAVARVLAPDGVAVFDLMNPARVRAHLVPASRREERGLVVAERRRIEGAGRLVVKDVELAYSDGTTRSWTERVRLYEPDEVDRLLRANGLCSARRFGAFDESAYSPTAPRQLVLARRA